MHQIKIWGRASQKEVKDLTIPDTQQDLMSFLRSQNIPVASSCDGEGVFKKCVINDEILSCQITCQQVIAQLKVIEIDYL